MWIDKKISKYQPHRSKETDKPLSFFSSPKYYYCVNTNHAGGLAICQLHLGVKSSLHGWKAVFSEPQMPMAMQETSI